MKFRVIIKVNFHIHIGTFHGWKQLQIKVMISQLVIKFFLFTLLEKNKVCTI